MCTSSDPSASKFPHIYEDLFKVDAETGKRNIDLNFEVSRRISLWLLSKHYFETIQNTKLYSGIVWGKKIKILRLDQILRNLVRIRVTSLICCL